MLSDLYNSILLRFAKFELSRYRVISSCRIIARTCYRVNDSVRADSRNNFKIPMHTIKRIYIIAGYSTDFIQTIHALPGVRLITYPIVWRLAKAPVKHTLLPLCDLSATDNFHQSQRSQQGPRWVPARLQRSRQLVGDLAATKSVAARFLNMFKNLAATHLVADRSRQSCRPVHDRSPTNFVRIGAWLSLKLVGDWSAIGRGPLHDLTANSRRPVRNLF